MSGLTVKWIVKYAEGETTRIFPADEVLVAYHDASANEPLGVQYAYGPNGVLELGIGDLGVGQSVDATLLINPNDEKTCKRLACGTCYVMNEAGKTIGTYRLDDVDIHGPSNQKGIHKSFRSSVPA